MRSLEERVQVEPRYVPINPQSGWRGVIPLRPGRTIGLLP
jgi:hypothetical protein